MLKVPPTVRKGFKGLADAMDMATASLIPSDCLAPGGLADCGCDKEKRGLGDKSSDTPDQPGGGRVDREWGNVIVDTKKVLGRDIPLGHQQRDPYTVCDTYSLRAVEFGNWMNEQNRQDWLVGSAVSLGDLANILNRRKHEMGFGKTLTVALGARGHGGRVRAHYEGAYRAINITKTKGKGTFAHEYAHAISHAIRRVEKLPALRGNLVGFHADKAEGDALNAVMETMFARIYTTANGSPSKFCEYMESLSSDDDYWTKREEVWARTFEAWVSKQLRESFSKNDFLCERSYATSSYYPSDADLERADRWIVLFLRKAFDMLRDGQAKPKAGRMMYGDKVTVETQQESIKGNYALVELDDLITSHVPNTWEPDERYPSGCQQRDYTADKAEQRAVIHQAQNLNPRFLVTDTPSATDGPPIVTPKGIVLGGNKRTMTLKITKDLQPYLEYLSKAVALFGFTVADIRSFRRPVLVRVIDIQMTQCAFYSNILNKGLTQGLDVTTESISYGRHLKQPDLEAIARIFEVSGAETLSQALEKRATAKSILDVFRRVGIITDKTTSQWVDPKSGDLSPLGRLMIERVLLGIVLPDKRLVDAAKNYTGHILRILPSLVRMNQLPAQWNLQPLIRSAIEAEANRRSTNTPKDLYLQQQSFDRPDIPRTVINVWDALDLGVQKWKNFVDRYLSAAEHESAITESGSIFGEKPRTPEQVLEAVAAEQGIAKAGGGSSPAVVRLGDPVTGLHGGITMNLKGTLRRWLGPIKHPSSILMWGDAGGGKSSLALVLANEWNRIGPALYIMSEERIASHRMEARARRMRVNPPALWRVEAHSIDTARQAIRAGTPTGPYALVIIDSVNDLSSKPLEVIQLLKEFPAQSFILIAQSDKVADKYAGPAKWKHAVDVIIEADAGTARTTKNRDNDLGTYRIW